jgi:hypothetical protein
VSHRAWRVVHRPVFNGYFLVRNDQRHAALSTKPDRAAR